MVKAKGCPWPAEVGTYPFSYRFSGHMKDWKGLCFIYLRTKELWVFILIAFVGLVFFFLKNANVTPHLAVLWTPPGDEVQGSQSLGLVPLSLPGVRFSSSCLSCVWTPGLPFSFFSDTLSPDLCPLRLANRTQVCSGLRLSLGENLEWIPPPRLTVHFQVILAPFQSEMIF